MQIGGLPCRERKKTRFKAPEGEFKRLTPDNSVRIAFEAEGKLPVDIGIELQDRRMQPIVKRGERIPFRHNEMYSTAAAYQTAVEMHFIVGNRPLAKDNMTIGRVRLREIRWSNQGLPMLDVLVGMDGATLSVARTTSTAWWTKVRYQTCANESRNKTLNRSSPMRKPTNAPTRNGAPTSKKATRLGFSSPK